MPILVDMSGTQGWWERAATVLSDLTAMWQGMIAPQHRVEYGDDATVS